MILIRADANPRIGMGHIMRCSSLADAFHLCNKEVCFILADDNAVDLVKNRGYQSVILNTSYESMDNELSFWPAVSAEIVIVDSYFVTDRYLKRLRERAFLVYIDDLASFPYFVDVLINYNLFGLDFDYHTLYKENLHKPEFVLGPKYAPIRAMFQGVPRRKQRRNVMEILFSTGGSDSLHLITKLLKLKPDKYIFRVLVGSMNTDKEEIRDLAEGQNNIILYENVNDMRSLICSCDIAISAAGSMLYEICTCGVPLITYIIADNQILGAEAFMKAGLGINYGDLRTCNKTVGGLLETVEILAQDYEKRVKMGYHMQGMIDGKGSIRLAKKIMNLAIKTTLL